MFGKLLEAVVKTVVLPVSIVADVVTIGGAITDKDESYTVTAIKDIAKDSDEIGD
jgi:hypothetical protein